MAAPLFYTAEMVRALPDDGKRYETVHGELLVTPADISWGPDILVQPDLFVVALEEARTLDWSRMQALLLAIEVLSPSSIRADRFTKRRLYQEVGIAEYWVVDADVESIEVWTPAAVFPSAMTGALRWAPPGFPPFELPLEELFRKI